MKNIISLLALLLVLSPLAGQAQDSYTSDTDRPWFYPDHVVIQFAGNIGLLSAGPGYSFNRDRMDAEILYGITPGFEARTSIHILTLKMSARPFQIHLKNGYLFEPVKFGTGFSYSVGPQFHTTWPGKYPDGYYWWMSSLRMTPFIGTTLSRKVGSACTLVKRVQVYSEVGTHDLGIVTFINNKNFSITEILNIALGTRLVF